MIFSKIMVAYDGSEMGRKALNKAIEFAQLNASVEIQVIHVVNYPVIVGAYVAMDDQISEMIMRDGEEVIEEAKQLLSALPNKSNTLVTKGSPVYRVIIDKAKSQGCDLIVVGSRGLSGLQELFLGSVSHNIAQHAAVPVLIVK